MSGGGNDDGNDSKALVRLGHHFSFAVLLEGHPTMNKRIVLSFLIGCLVVLIGFAGQAQAVVNTNKPVKKVIVAPTLPLMPSTVPGYDAQLLGSGMDDPWGVGVLPKGRDAFVNDSGDNTLWRYRYGTFSQIMTTGTSLEAGRYRGRYYVGDNLGHIYKFKAGVGLESIMFAVPGPIMALDVDPANGDIYFIANGNVPFRLPKGSQFPVGLGIVLPNQSYGIAVRSRHLYISQYDTGLIYRLPKKGGALTVAFSGLNGPTDLVFNKDGDLFVAEYNGGSIAHIPSTFSSIKRIAWGFIEPFTLGVDLNDNVILVDNGAAELWLLKKK